MASVYAAKTIGLNGVLYADSIDITQSRAGQRSKSFLLEKSRVKSIFLDV